MWEAFLRYPVSGIPCRSLLKGAGYLVAGLDVVLSFGTATGIFFRIAAAILIFLFTLIGKVTGLSGCFVLRIGIVGFSFVMSFGHSICFLD